MSARSRRNPDANFRALKLMVQAEERRKASSSLRPGAVYRSPEELLLELGRRWTWRPLSRDWSPMSRWGLERACFANSVLGAILHRDLRYVEGFAYAGTIPIHHAWCVDQNDVVVDFTWQERELLPRLGRAYLGVVVPIERAIDCVWGLGASVFDDPPEYRSIMEPWVVNDHPPLPSDEAITEFITDAGGEGRADLLAKLRLAS